MTELEALKARHSVRSYENKRIEDQKIKELEALIETCNKEGNMHLQLLADAGNTFKRLMSRVMGLGTAPSVIACVGPDGADLDERVGYYGQKVVLLAQQLGLNTCWAGTYQAKGVPCKIEKGERLVIVIALGYGTTQGKVRKTKTADQVVRGGIEGKPDWFKRGVEAALLAPTAINQQKFEIVLGADDSVEFIDKGGVLSKVDQGIVKYNFEVGSR